VLSRAAAIGRADHFVPPASETERDGDAPGTRRDEARYVCSLPSARRRAINRRLSIVAHVDERAERQPGPPWRLLTSVSTPVFAGR
jgi:hypothetical protein